MGAAKWHREQAQNARNSGAKLPPESNPARRYVEIASHHAAAADALEALAVPGVAGLIEGVLCDDWMGHLDLPIEQALEIKNAQRAALSTLAKIASEGK